MRTVGIWSIIEGMNAAELYDRDFAEWAMRNAELLRSGRVAEADLDHIAEEIEGMAKRERRAMQIRLARLIQNLLKWQVQPMKRSASWQHDRRAAFPDSQATGGEPQLPPGVGQLDRPGVCARRALGDA